MVNFDPLFFKESSSPEKEAKKALDKAWEKLSEGGTVLMPIDEYPFSKRYGWIQDKFGLSWQLILTNPEGDPRPMIMPSLMFVDDKAGRAEDAINFYVSVFKDSKKGETHRYGPDQVPDKEGTIMFAANMASNLTRRSRLWSSAKRKNKLIITGRNFRLFRKQNSADGLRTSSAFPGR